LLVLLRDERLPSAPGVSRWRQEVRDAFTAAGARVEERTWHAPPTPTRPTVPTRGKLAWLPRPARAPLAAGYRLSRATLARRRAAQRSRALHQELAGARLVIAESIEAAVAAVTAGVPRDRVWALALPAHRLHLGEPTGFAAEVARAADLIGGFLTASESARDSLERAASANRPRVELFPIEADDSHPLQRSSWSGTAAPTHGEPAESIADPGPVRLATARRVWEAVTPPPPSPRRPRGVLLTGFDLKFARELADRLARRPDLTITVDDWPALMHGTRQTPARLRRADSIFAEFARTSAVYASRHKRPGQFLAIRLHRYELEAPYPAQIAIENVDAVVYIAPLFGRRIRDELGWPSEKLVYIPNYLDLDWFDRPKLPEARFALGLVGIEWSRKRFDLALDLLAAVRREDRRFTLVVRSTMPWHNRYAWTDPAERAYTGACFARVERDPLLQHAVSFDQPGRDMARWFRGIGHVLSTSDEEGSHTAVAEGMAAGSVPVVRPWPGAAELYDKQWIHATVEDAAAAVLANADADRWAAQAAGARAEVHRSHDPAAVLEAWADLLHGDLAAAKRHFAGYVTLSEMPAPATPGPRRPAVPADRR
jgi:glycosyltransferase involved in cell wall biosynthesis